LNDTNYNPQSHTFFNKTPATPVFHHRLIHTLSGFIQGFRAQGPGIHSCQPEPEVFLARIQDILPLRRVESQKDTFFPSTGVPPLDAIGFVFISVVAVFYFVISIRLAI
jgi:hypothetical protein